MNDPEDMLKDAEEGCASFMEANGGRFLWLIIVAAWILAFFVLTGGD